MGISICFVGIAMAHYFGDFWMQTEWMSRGKSQDMRCLAAHTLVYTSVMGFYMLLLLPFNWTVSIGLILFNGIAHGIVDYFTSRRNARLWTEGKVKKFFDGIGLDQLLHQLTLGISFMMAWGLT